MKEILFNLALIDVMQFCKSQGVDCSGTHLHKYPRRYTYALVRDNGNELVATTTFHKNQVPTHSLVKQPCGHTHSVNDICPDNIPW